MVHGNRNKEKEHNRFHIMGFRHSLLQPNINIFLNIPEADISGLSEVDAWLARCFRIPFRNGFFTGSFPEAGTPSEAIAHRMMELANAILRMGNIPCFDRGVISGEVPNGAPKGQGGRQLAIITPMVENFDAKWILAAYGIASSILMEALNSSIHALDMDDISDLIEKEIIKPCEKAASSAKTSLSITQGAYNHSIPFTHLGNSYYQLGWGSKGLLFDKSSVFQDSAIGSRLTHNKVLCSRVLQAAGFPVPRNIPVSDWESTRQAAKELGYPVVVKPVDRNRGEGVSVNIKSSGALKEAYRLASQFSKSIMVEEMVPGLCHRMLVANGKLLYALARHPLHLLGDGRHKVSELIDQANATEALLPRYWRQKPFPKDELARQSLRAAGYDFDDIPPPGAKLPLRPIEKTEWGGIMQDVGAIAHPDNIALAIRAAEQFGLAICGVDLITPDISVPWHRNGAKLNELNYLPEIGLKFEHHAKGMVTLMTSLFPSQGRIPVELIVGGEAALRAARGRQAEMIESGLRCHVATHENVWGPNGIVPLDIQQAGLFRRCRTALLNRNVDALVMVAQTDELLLTGLPVDRLDSFEIIDRNIKVIKRPGSPDASTAVELIGKLVAPHLESSSPRKDA